MRQPPQELLHPLISIISPILFTNLGPWPFSIFSCSFTMIFWSLSMALSMIKEFSSIFSIHTVSGRLCSITLSVWIGKSHKIYYYYYYYIIIIIIIINIIIIIIIIVVIIIIIIIIIIVVIIIVIIIITFILYNETVSSKP